MLVFISKHMSVDKVSQDFLRVLLEYGGDADTTTIRSETGMSRGQVNHRYKKLDDLGWIDIERAEQGEGNRTPPKIAVLTEEGKQAIRSGDAGKEVLGKEVSGEGENNSIEVNKEQMETFYQEIEGMKNQLNVIVQQLNTGQRSVSEDSTDDVGSDKLKQLERDVSSLEETVQLLNKSLSQQKKKRSKRLNEMEEKLEKEGSIDEEILDEVKEDTEFFNEWMDVAQKYMLTIRLFIDDQDDVSFEEYFEKAEEHS